MNPSQVSHATGTNPYSLLSMSKNHFSLLTKRRSPSGSNCQPWYLQTNLRVLPHDLLLRVVLPHELVAAVRAHVVERADHTVATPGDDQRGSQAGELTGEVVTWVGDLELAPDVEPRASEHRVELVFVVPRIDRVVERHVAGAHAGTDRPALVGLLEGHARGCDSVPACRSSGVSSVDVGDARRARVTPGAVARSVGGWDRLRQVSRSRVISGA